jgi:hypothetical protein
MVVCDLSRNAKRGGTRTGPGHTRKGENAQRVHSFSCWPLEFLDMSITLSVK